MCIQLINYGFLFHIINAYNETYISLDELQIIFNVKCNKSSKHGKNIFLKNNSEYYKVFKFS